ncbi:MAG: lysophospholipid acyltransferase family protein [Parvibaculaceae bacterium]|nr:lysophospholipid acyltransferase family protein [Parvibaculaceae bacterium]
MLYLRSTLFNLVFYGASVIIVFLGLPLFLGPRSGAMWISRQWSLLTIWLLRVLAGTKYEIRGREFMPSDPALVAAKHQSMWDTIIATAVFDDPAMIMKRELLYIPFYGWYTAKAGMIAINRGAHASALRKMLAAARRESANGRPIIIYPEGSRVAPDAAPDYKIGVAALYKHLKLPCIPVATNSGLYWPRRRFLRHPGTIVLEFLPPIPPGLSREAFMARLIGTIEPATARLLAEGRREIARH